MAEKLPPLPFDGATFYADPAIAVLTPEEEAAVHRLRWYQWRDGALPADPDDLERMIGRMISERVLRLFPVLEDDEASRANPELLDQRARMWVSRERMSEGGSRGRQQQLTSSPKPGRRRALPSTASKDAQATPEATPQWRPQASPQASPGGSPESLASASRPPSQAVDLFASQGTPEASPQGTPGATPAPLVPPLSPTPPISPLNPPSPGKNNLAAGGTAAEETGSGRAPAGQTGVEMQSEEPGSKPIGKPTSWPARFAEILVPIGEFHPARVGKALAIVVRRYSEPRAEEMVRAFAEHGPHLRADGQIDPDHDAPQFCTPERLAQTAGFWYRYTDPIPTTPTRNGSHHAPAAH